MHDTSKNYGLLSKGLHWLIALSIIALLIAGFVMINLSASPVKWQIYSLHKAIGITLIAFLLVRIFWRIKSGRPSCSHPKWQRVAASIVHGLLYLTTLLMPISGWVMSMASGHIPSWFGFFELRLPIQQSKVLAKTASTGHEFLAWLIACLLVVHIIAAITDKKTLQRMLFKKN